MKQKIVFFFKKINIAVYVFIGLTILLCIVGFSHFTSTPTSMKVSNGNPTESSTGSTEPNENRDDNGYIIYKTQSNLSLKKGETCTFEIPFGTRIQRHNTEGRVTKLSSKGKKYTLRAETDVTFDLTWVIEKGFENKIKPL